MPYSFSSYCLTSSSLFIHYSLIQPIPTAFITSPSPVIPLLSSLIPIARTLHASAPFPTSSDLWCITACAPSTLLFQFPRLSGFSQEEQNEKKEGRIHLAGAKRERKDVSEAAHHPPKVMLPLTQNRIVAGKQLPHVELYFLAYPPQISVCPG